MLNILIDMPVYAPVLQALQRLPNVKVAVIDPPEEKARVLPTDLIRDCDALFCTFLPENYDEMERLKLVQIASVGYTQLVGKALAERGVRACNALGVFDVPIAEWNIAMMINLARDLRGLIRNQDAGIWDRSAVFQKEIRGSVVGLWGYGGIGRETARLAKALGMTVHVLVRQEVSKRDASFAVPETGDSDGSLPDRIFTMNEKDAFLEGLDFLIMGIPQTATTTGIVGENELRLLPPHAFLLNPARGPLVQEAALLRALREGWIAGAALDTHYQYPMPPDHPLWQFPNVIMTPHISGSSLSPRFLERVSSIFLQNVSRYQRFEPLLNELTPAQLSGQ
ncbi:D-2-hydroxyacid dehydrogenase [Larkinella knui]|uniref:D-2-hydroxyacid dehydrogenase n=1 Tax=Larkinella knui TaxID=2025310 RepID=A0A3P1CNG5_9BACT|nr:D-2-hydroxyacid dehydrogenase [Larkinella knui]RRB14873.1 D-2-hydroxyacid dehydrogenase [Larkinella knui]